MCCWCWCCTSFSGDPTSAAVPGRISSASPGLLRHSIQFISNFCPSSIAPKFLKRFNRYPPFSPFLSFTHSLHSLLLSSWRPTIVTGRFPLHTGRFLSCASCYLWFASNFPRSPSTYLIESLANLPYLKKVAAILP